MHIYIYIYIYILSLQVTQIANSHDDCIGAASKFSLDHTSLQAHTHIHVYACTHTNVSLQGAETAEA